MKPTEILSAEHRVIERVLNALENMLEKAEDDNQLDGESANKALDFIRNFADQYHHGKEENQLFVLLEEKGMPRDSGPIGCMREEHDLGREYVATMSSALKSASEGVKTALEIFSKAAQGYCDLLRQHIMKEDRILYPMGDNILTSEDQKELLRRFEIVNQECGSDTYAKYLAIAEDLAVRFGASSQPKCGGCCNCGEA